MMRMNKYIYASLFLLTGAMTSCDDILDAPTISATDESVVFSSYTLAENAVLGITNSFGEVNYRGRFSFYGTNTDMEWWNAGGTATDEKAQLTNYSATSLNGQMNKDDNLWAMMYEGIEKANLVIRGLETYADMNDPDFRQLLGEALTYRAIYYSDLIKMWGDVPMRFEPLTTETMYIARTDKDSIYVRLLDDLYRAEEMVAWPNETTTTGTVERVSKAFVKGLRARIALWAGGYSQRADGTTRLSNDPRLAQDAMWQIAKDECTAIIGQGCNTLGDFEQTFRDLMAETVTAGRESLWEIPYSNGRGRILRDFGLKHDKADQYTGMVNGGLAGPTPIAFYKYDPEDVRRNVTCVPYGWTTDASGHGYQTPLQVSKWYFGKYRYEWVTSRFIPNGNDDGMNWIYMRYADIYLMAAEAVNELDGPQAAAQYLKPILDRALPAEKVDAYMAQATASKDAFREAVIEQRGLEFCGEMLRKADLIRWNRLGSALRATKEELELLRTHSGKYAALPEKIYYQTVETEPKPESLVFDEVIPGETVEIYGLELGQTDEIGASLGYVEEPMTWAGKDNWEDKVNGLFVNDPDTRPYWPIWQVFIDNSNGMLVNYPNYQ